MKKCGIEIFSGAGGLSLGAEMAGINIKYAIEMNPSAAKTFKRNHKKAHVYCEDIRQIDPSLEFKKDEIFIVMGGPPCQGFSLSNTKTRNLENPNNFLFKEFVRFVKVINPAWFIFENVPGFKNFNNGKMEKLVEYCFHELKYNVQPAILCASEFGVPQARHRFFIVGNRLKIDFKFPEAFNYTISVEEAIGDLPVLSNGDMSEELPYRLDKSHASMYAKLMRKNSKSAKQNYVSRNNDLVIERYKCIKQGENWKAIPENLMRNYTDKRRCHSGIYKRLKANEPSVVISNYRKSMLIHPFEDRGISVREAARLQSFPDNFIFEGPISHIQQQIGNAVPPLLSKAIVSKILSYSQPNEYTESCVKTPP